MKKWPITILGFVTMILAGCNGSTDKEAETQADDPVPADSITVPEVNADSSQLLDRLVFFELVNPGLGKVYNLHSESLTDDLHGKYVWPVEEELMEYPGDSSLEDLAAANPDIPGGMVHKFFGVSRLKELRFGDVIKVRMTWEEAAPDGRLRSRFKLYRNENHKWTAFANPGSFTFPGDGAMESLEGIPPTKEMLNLVKKTLVRVTYKLGS